MRNVISVIMVILAGASLVQGDTEWTSGHHEIVDGDGYGEIWMYNNATADMWGGDVYQLGALDSSRFSMFGGTIDELLVRYNSIVNIYGGTLSMLDVYREENGLVNLYAYDVIYHSTGGHYDRGWIEGYYIGNDAYFSFDFASADAFSHINIVAEPVNAEIDITPHTLNLASKGKWINCKIWLPEDYNVADVNSASVLLENEVPAGWIWFNKKQNVVMAKFRRSEVQEILVDLQTPTKLELLVTGELNDGRRFEGTDTIRVIDKRSKKKGSPGAMVLKKKFNH